MSNIKDTMDMDFDETYPDLRRTHPIGKYFGYLDPKLRSQYTNTLVENVLKNISDKEILFYCPQYLGPDVGPQHREYIKAKARKELDALDDYTLIRRYVDQDPKDELTKESFKQGGYLGDKSTLN